MPNRIAHDAILADLVIFFIGLGLDVSEYKVGYSGYIVNVNLL